MQIEPRLDVQAGWASLRGRRPDNQDYAGFAGAGPRGLSARGLVAAVADGCGGTRGGRTAAELCVRCFIDGYYSLPETLGIQPRAARALASINSWIHSLGQRDPEHANMATTFSALILQAREAHLVHVGDSRIYRLRGDRLDQLTQDHTLKGGDRDHILYRAVGLENAMAADGSVHSVEGHDRYLICTDGLHTALRKSDLLDILRLRQAPEACAETLAQAALERGGHDNITALVVDVVGLPLPGTQFLLESIEALPLSDLPGTGDRVDGYQLGERISEGRYSSLFLAEDSRTGSRVVLKFPHPRVASEREYHLAFMREAWIGLRIRSPWVAEIIEQPPGRQTRLYSVMPYYKGQTLEQRITGQPGIGLAEGIDIALKICRAVYALHRQRVIHRDIKPDNILCLEDGGLKLLDLGIARLPAFEEDSDSPLPGTASYMAPELFEGGRGSVQSDVYAVGVTLFRLFGGGSYPYGEIEPFTHPHFGRPKSLASLRPDLPAWLGTILHRAVAVDPRERCSDTIELAFELENALAKGGQHVPERVALYRRNPLLFWQILSLALLLALLVCAWRGETRHSLRPESASGLHSTLSSLNNKPASHEAGRYP